MQKEARMYFAIVPAKEATDMADALVATVQHGQPPCVQVHPQGDIDELILPEYATEAAQGWVVGWIAGGASGLLAGVLTGAMGWVTGLSVGMGAGLGLVSGILVGGLCASMSGHRLPNVALRNAVASLEDHERLLTVDLADQSQGPAVLRALEASDPRLLKTL